jgi:putative ABC transport system permease protein
MQAIAADFKRAWHALTRSPSYALMAMLVFAIGIGATTTLFGVIKAVVLNPLPYPEQNQLIQIRESSLPDFPKFSVAPGKFMIWQKQNTAFQAMGMYQALSFNLTGRDQPQRMNTLAVTDGYFDTLGAPLALGRGFAAADLANQADSVVLSYATWMALFAGDRNVIGQNLTLNDRSYSIIGVTSKQVLSKAKLYTLWRVGAKEANEISGHYAGVIARLKTGKTEAEANSELNHIAEQMEKQYDDARGWRVLTTSLAKDALGAANDQLSLLMVGALLVLVIATVNVASLTLVRTALRTQEFAARSAHGATASHIRRQLVAEGVLLASGGGLLGAALVMLAFRFIREAAPNLPRIDSLALDLPVLGVAILASLIAGVIAALLPSALASSKGIAATLRSGGRGSVGGQRRLRGALVASEVALAVVLLIGAGILTRSLLALNAVDPGFKTGQSYYAYLELPESRYSDTATARRFTESLEMQMTALPGVKHAALTQSLPMQADHWLTFEVQGRPTPKVGEEPSSLYSVVSADFFAALRIKLLRGRLLQATDRDGSARVIVVSQAYVDRFFPNEEAIGKQIRVGNGDDAWREIVGIVASTRQYGLDRDLEPQLYEPLAQAPETALYLVVNTRQPLASTNQSLRAMLSRLDPNLPLSELKPIAQMVDDSLATRRMSSWLIAGFGLTALLLAGIGLYGTIAYSVSQASKEIGVRLAMGASRNAVLQAVLRQGLTLAGIGAVIGIGIALMSARVLEGFVFGISTRDPLTYVVIASTIMLVALVAAALPAWRATRVSPMVALRAND